VNDMIWQQRVVPRTCPA